MKKILCFIVFAIMVAGCKDCECGTVKPAQTNTDTQRTGTTTIDIDCDDEVNDEIGQNGDDWCDDTDIYDFHLIKSAEYKNYKKRKWNTSSISEKIIYWSDISSLIGNDTCYDKYIQFTYDKNGTDNSTIRITTSNCFDTYGSCYSIPLLLAIQQKYHLTGMSYFECSIAKDEIGEFVIFKYKVNALSNAYFDVSRFPKYLTHLKDKHNQIK